MYNDNAKKNESWAFQIIDQLTRLGVRYFCIAPGSRSSSLTLAAACHPKVETLVHFDERGLAFHALGYGKAAGTPAAIIVTSGTAVGNLFPAIMEASAARIPMIILTADRPPELRDCGANQTADQVKIFGNLVRWHVDVPCPEDRLPQSYLPSLLSYAVFKSCKSPCGPVHINCMFREPLHTLDTQFPVQTADYAVHYETCIPTCSESSLLTLSEKLSTYSSGMILVGSLSNPSEAKDIVELGRIMKWPIISDITSHTRPFSNDIPCIPYIESIIKNSTSYEVDCVLHFGDRTVSKTVSQWLSMKKPDYYLIADHPDRYDPYGYVHHRLYCNISWFCNRFKSYVQTKESFLLAVWLERSVKITQTIKGLFSNNSPLSEPSIIHMLSRILPKEWNVFISNSMPVRDADAFFYPEDYQGKIFVNRGISGIDGNISTAAGIAFALKKPLVAVLGDLAFMHDMNAVIQISKSTVPVILLVINNGGGGIFSFLPISGKTKKFEEYFATAHEYHFENLATFAGIEFHKPENSLELTNLYNDLIANPRSCFIEVITDREENVAIHKQIDHALQESLCSQLEPTAK